MREGLLGAVVACGNSPIGSSSIDLRGAGPALCDGREEATRLLERHLERTLSIHTTPKTGRLRIRPRMEISLVFFRGRGAFSTGFTAVAPLGATLSFQHQFEARVSRVGLANDNAKCGVNRRPRLPVCVRTALTWAQAGFEPDW